MIDGKVSPASLLPRYMTFAILPFCHSYLPLSRRLHNLCPLVTCCFQSYFAHILFLNPYSLDFLYLIDLVDYISLGYPGTGISGTEVQSTDRWADPTTDHRIIIIIIAPGFLPIGNVPRFPFRHQRAMSGCQLG